MSIYCTGSQSFEERPPTFSWASLRREFVFTPLRMKTALKVAVGATVALFLACVFNWKSAGLAMVMSPLFDRPDTRFDLRQSLGAAIATAALSTFLYWSLNWSQQPLVFGLLVGGVLVFYGSLSTLPVYGFCFAMAHLSLTAEVANWPRRSAAIGLKRMGWRTNDGMDGSRQTVVSEVCRRKSEVS